MPERCPRFILFFGGFMTTKFKVGDRVRILRKVRSHARGWENSWISEMDKAVGKIGQVTYVSSGRAHDVNVKVPEAGDWGYPDFALKLVVKTSKKKVRK
jgi:Mind bomb SH3 repeat domain